MSTTVSTREQAGAPPAFDAEVLPSYGFGDRSLMWWGTLGLIAIETTVFAMTVMAYFYLRSHATQWPLSTEPPALLWGSISAVIMVLSIVPNHWAKRAAERFDLRALRPAMAICLLFAVALLLVRIMELRHLNVRWDTDAYGSAVWLLMGLHTVHLLTDAYDTAVLLALFYLGPLEERRYVDASENAMYWYFVVYSWLPIYLVVYWAPRWL